MNKVYDLHKRASLFFAFVLTTFGALADGSIRGYVIDKDAAKRTPLEDVQVVVKLSGVYKADVRTDEKGFFDIKSLPAGRTYSLTFILTEYQKLTLEGIIVNDDNATDLKDISLPKLSMNVKEVVVVGIKNPPLRQGVIGTHITGTAIQRMANRNVNYVAGLAGGVISRNGGTPSFLGSRANQTGYFINGVKVIGSIPLIPDALNEVSVITGGVPAQYGDFTGGAINLTFKLPTLAYITLFDYSNSMPFNRYNFQQLQAYFSGPLKVINKQDVGKERVILGYTIALSAVTQRDGNPSAIPLYKLKDEKLAELENKPNSPAPTGDGLVPSASYVNANDFERIKYRLNAQGSSLSFLGTLTYQPTKNIQVQAGMNGGWSRGANYSFTSSMFNYKNASESTNLTSRFNVSMTHKLKSSGDKKEDKKDDKSLVTDALYTVRADYTIVTSSTYDPRHKYDTWQYGYVGDFTTYKAPSFRYVDNGLNGQNSTFVDQNGKTVVLRNYFEQSGYRDTAITFQRSELNPISANYTQQVFDQYGRLIKTATTVQALGGLMNGDGPNSVYGMWTNVGAYPGGYSKSRSEQFTLFAIGEASLAPPSDRSRKHDIQFGLSYEQRSQRGYSLASAALWNRSAALANQAVLELDRAHPILAYDENGVFQDTVYYNRLFNPADESVFARNMRQELMANGAKDVYGNPIAQNSWIDVNSMDPKDMKLSWFSPDDLFNNGNQFFSGFGYDYMGNVVKGRPSIKDWNDNPNRPIGAFAPINAAAWIQDRFDYKDIKFRLGLRAEQFDANIKVLKDPYLLFPARTAAEWKNQEQIPGTIGSDYTVYVDNYKSASPNIVGYRNGSTWYNKEGNVIADPSVLAQSGGRIQPWLVDPKVDLSKYKLDANAFQDYAPTPIFMPRIWFSFPISDKAEFFANYDVLSQRPAEGFFSTNADYQYFERRALDGTLNNPNVRPSKKTSYEVGYKQALDERSAISFIASYAETRDLIQLKRFYQAFPTSYTAFGNEDFSTAKAFRIEYFLYGFKHMDIVANYSLLFADGTGSSASTSAGLVAVNKPSLKTLQPLDVDFRHTIKVGVDYRYKTDKDHPYDGPMMRIKGKERKILEDFGMNFQVQAFSGAPYTATANKNVSQIIGGTASRNPIQGTINGQRLPGQVYCDFTIDKSWNIYYKSNSQYADPKTGKRNFPLNVYIAVTNVFNTTNVLGVYSNTGLATDDGYLTSADGIRASNNQINQQAFVDQYKLRLNNPGLYALPRMARIGVRVIFNSRKDL
jgi:hypothetical protein